MRRAALLLLSLMALLGVMVAPADAGARSRSLPERIALPDGWRPEGITSGKGATFYVGSLANGAIWRGDFRTGEGRVLYAGREGGVAVGIDYERGAHRIWAAGGATGQANVHDARTGALLRTYQLTAPDAGFVNDVVVTRWAAYFTDSVQQQLYVVPLGKHDRLPAEAFTLPLTGDLEYVEGFNLNGIAAAKGGRVLFVVQSNTGLLFRVNPWTGVTRQVDLGDVSLTNGDGIEVQGRTVYVVRNQLNQVFVLRLNRGLTSGRLVSTITDPDPSQPLLDVPTTATLALGKLWVVNARFGMEPTEHTEYWVTRLPRR